MQSFFSTVGNYAVRVRGVIDRGQVFGSESCRLDPSHEKQDDKHDQDDADDPDAAMAITVAVPAEAATEPADEYEDEYDDEDKSERHRAFLSEVRFSRDCKKFDILICWSRLWLCQCERPDSR